MGSLTRTALAINVDLLEKFDAWMAGRGYTNRSEAMRDLIRAALVEQQWQDPKAAMVAGEIRDSQKRRDKPAWSRG